MRQSAVALVVVAQVVTLSSVETRLYETIVELLAFVTVKLVSTFTRETVDDVTAGAVVLTRITFAFIQIHFTQLTSESGNV